MKQTSSLLLLIIATILLPLSCIDYEPEPYEPTVLPGTPFKKTVLVYMAAQNSLGAKGFALEDSTEMADGMKYLHDKERVLMFLDDNKAPRLYELRKGLHSPRLLRKWETDINSADTAQLTRMLRFMQEFSPSESYGLVLWATSLLAQHAQWFVGNKNNHIPSSAIFGCRTQTRCFSPQKLWYGRWS